MVVQLGYARVALEIRQSVMKGRRFTVARRYAALGERAGGGISDEPGAGHERTRHHSGPAASGPCGHALALPQARESASHVRAPLPVRLQSGHPLVQPVVSVAIVLHNDSRTPFETLVVHE